MNTEEVRILEVRQQSADTLQPECLKYPFYFLITGEYETAVYPIPGHESADAGNFPHNIEHYYWIHEGENDIEPWITLCRLTNGAYVFYKGECDYTGFDCQGNMKLYSSHDVGILIQYAMSESDYEKYIIDTTTK
jgi:hypothetical protein